MGDVHHCSGAPVSEMTYTVSSGMLNSTIPYHFLSFHDLSVGYWHQMHGSETWPMKVEHELKLNWAEISMIRWMCGVKLNERKKVKNSENS